MKTFVVATNYRRAREVAAKMGVPDGHWWYAANGSRLRGTPQARVLIEAGAHVDDEVSALYKIGAISVEIVT